MVSRDQSYRRVAKSFGLNSARSIRIYGCFPTRSGDQLNRNLLSRSELHPKAMEEQMTRHPKFVEDNKKPLKPKADDQSHEPAKHIEEIARLASSVETAKDPSKVRRPKD